MLENSTVIMQPIILLTIVAVAAGALGIGSMANVIDLSMVQSLGVGQTDLETDVVKANVDFEVLKVPTLGNNNAVPSVITSPAHRRSIRTER